MLLTSSDLRNFWFVPAAVVALICTPTIQAENLVPTTPGTAPNYWCTWNAQGYQWGIGVKDFDCSLQAGEDGSQRMQDVISQSTIFGANGWARTFYPKVRSDLYFLLDDGAFSNESNNSFILDPARFSSFPNVPLGSQWKKINDSLKTLGWRSAGIWCRDPEGSNPLPIQWSKNAGIDYWKIDGGDDDMRQEAMRTQYNYPQLIMEHKPAGNDPLNLNGGRFGSQSWNSENIALMKKCDVLRTYDIINAFSAVTTLDRVAELLKGVNGHPEVTCRLNVENEVYIAAGLGCLMGIMRHPMDGLITPDCDVGFMIKPGTRQLKKRMDEITRAVRWHRIAPPFAAGLYTTTVSTNVLTDSWHFAPNETWVTELDNTTESQGAYAKIARGLALPTVTGSGTSSDSLPFVIASKYPNGAVSIAAIGRCKPTNGWFIPRADVELDAGTSTGPVGVFGQFKSLKIKFAQIPANATVLAQDLAGDVATDITGRLTITSTSITIPGSVISEIGLSAGTAGDLSDPGLVLALRSSTGVLPSASRHSPQALSNRRLAVVDRIFSSSSGRVKNPANIGLVDIRGRNAGAFDQRTLANGVYIPR